MKISSRKVSGTKDNRFLFYYYKDDPKGWHFRSVWVSDIQLLKDKLDNNGLSIQKFSTRQNLIKELSKTFPYIKSEPIYASNLYWLDAYPQVQFKRGIDNKWKLSLEISFTNDIFYTTFKKDLSELKFDTRKELVSTLHEWIKCNYTFFQEEGSQLCI